MSKILGVCGATGQQGRSVIDFVLNDAELSKQFKVRGITRDPSKPAGQELQKLGVEVVKGDANDHDSLRQAMQGAHTIFSMTVSVYDDQLKPRELAQGKAIADAAVAAGVEYVIFSSLSNGSQISEGRLKHMAHFDVKEEIEQYIRGLPIKSAFFAPGAFMQNFDHMMTPHPVGDGTYALSSIVKPEAQLPLIDVVGDTGKYIGAILAEPDKYEGKVFSAATDLYSYTEVTEVMSKASGQTVKYNQLPVDVFRGFLPPQPADYLIDMYLFIQDYGYYGPGTKQKVEWTAKQARGKLTTLEEYFAKKPMKLQ